eukprot:2604526-Amphidinium_carterae.1
MQKACVRLMLRVCLSACSGAITVPAAASAADGAGGKKVKLFQFVDLSRKSARRRCRDLRPFLLWVYSFATPSPAKQRAAEKSQDSHLNLEL